jgi:glycosyltransferase involved in cell wall biosynthesis
MVISPKALRIALSASRGLPVNIIYWCRGSVVPAKIVARGWHRRVAAFICLSDTIKRASVKAGVPEAKLRVVPNAIDVEQLQKRAEAPLAGSLPDVDEPIRILVAATLLPGKGQACAIRALRRLREEGRHAVLYLAGDTGSAGHKYEFELRRLAENLGVADSVHLLGWRDDLPQLMMKSTVFALPSHSEGMPRSVMEAMALRIPVVATPVGSVPEILDNGRAGYIVGIDDDAALAASIAAASQSAQVLTAKVQAAHEIISQRYVPPVQVRCFLDMIDSLCTSVVAQ